VTGFIYTDQKAPAEIRGQAQSLLVFLTQGLGMFVGYRMAFGGNVPFTGMSGAEGVAMPNSIGEIGRLPEGNAALTESIKLLNEGKVELSFFEKMMGMFGKGYPEGVDPALVTKAMSDWKSYWMFPAMMATAVSVIFLLAFWEKKVTKQA
jgi:hypothetical protein